MKHTSVWLRRILVELLRIYQRRRRGEDCNFSAGEWMQSCLDRNPFSNVLETTEEQVEQAKRIFREASSSSLFDRQCEMAEQAREEKEVSTQPRPSAEKVSTQPRPNAEKEKEKEQVGGWNTFSTGPSPQCYCHPLVVLEP